MTTPDTSAVRAWARDNGFDVADRGRLSAEIVDAYVASRKKGGAGKPATKAPATAKALAAKAPASATPASAPKAPADPTEEFADASLEAVTADPPAPHADATQDDVRLTELAEQIRELSGRVDALERSSTAGRPAKSRFRRQR